MVDVGAPVLDLGSETAQNGFLLDKHSLEAIEA